MQCGAACLSMICHYYGKSLSLSELSDRCSTTTEGVSLLTLSRVAETLGMKTLCSKLSIKKICDSKLPCILHWNQNHFVVLYKIERRGNRFCISDPATGKYKLSAEKFNYHWISSTSQGQELGVAMFLEPTDQFYSNNIKNKIEKHSFRFLWDYILLYRKHFVLIIIGLILGCVLQLIIPFLTQWIVDAGIKHKDINLIWLILLGELMIILGRTAIDFIRRWLLLHISMRINISLVSDFFIKMFKLPMSFFDTKLTGDILQRMSDHGTVQSFLTNQLLTMTFAMLSFTVLGVVLLIYNRVVFYIFGGGSLIYGIWIACFLTKRRVLNYEIFEQQALSQNCTYQIVTSMQEIKLQDCEQRRRLEWENCQANLYSTQLKSLKLQQTQEAGCIFINELKNILITAFAASAVIYGQITLGAMLAVQYIIGQLNSPIEQLMRFIYSIQDVKISLERINEIHLAKDEQSFGLCINKFATSKRIELKSIDFKYDFNSQKKALANISLVIPEGKVTAIVGASGSGKTTLIKILLGYYKVLTGEIQIAGININNIDLKWWRKHCGVVMQDGVIFSESIARNIAISDGDIDVKQLEQAARLANIHEYIMSLPLTYNTKIGRDGVGLSQGQKQRILIARAIYKNPDFIFLDEATNSLDAKNERVIVENLNTFYKGKTVVVVAHRLSTVMNADQIVVLDNGKIVEAGSHKRLIEKKGTYYNLVKNQLELGD